MKEEGYEVAHDGLLVTVFSAPNYCDQMGNKGAYVRFNGNDMVPHFTTFEVIPGGGGSRYGTSINPSLLFLGSFAFLCTAWLSDLSKLAQTALHIDAPACPSY